MSESEKKTADAGWEQTLQESLEARRANPGMRSPGPMTPQERAKQDVARAKRKEEEAERAREAAIKKMKEEEERQKRERGMRAHRFMMQRTEQALEEQRDGDEFEIG